MPCRYLSTKHLAKPEKATAENEKDAKHTAVYRNAEVWAISVHHHSHGCFEDRSMKDI